MKALKVFGDKLGSSLVAKIAALPVDIRKQAAVLQQMHSDIEAPDSLMERLAGLLRHQPTEWLYLYKDHPLRTRTEKGLKDTIPTLDEHAVILVHPHEKWCLVAQDDVIYPAVFKSSVMDTHLHKIISGIGTRWLLTMRKDIALILETQSYTDGETTPQLTHFDINNDPVARLTGAGFRL